MRVNAERIFKHIRNSVLISAIRDGLVSTIPIVMIGSFFLAFQTLPVDAYQQFLQNFLSGALLDIFVLVHYATFKTLSVYVVLAVSFKLSNTLPGLDGYLYGVPFAGLGCFFIFSGVFTDASNFSALGPGGMSIALISAIGGAYLYRFIAVKTGKLSRLFADGADIEFNNALSVVLTTGIVLLLGAALNHYAVKRFNVSGFHELLNNLLVGLFDSLGRNLSSGLLFMLLLNLLWVFGIHGSNMLEPVSQILFVPAVFLNQNALAAGRAPTEIISKTFFDVFVLMGGCGASLCLLLAVLLFSKRRSNLQLSRIAVFPMLFNINELMIFGLPVVLNPMLIIPFIITPIVVLLTSYYAMASGLVPLAAYPTEWTTPIIINGYIATGSIKGSLLQLFNLALGVIIYRPFIKLYDKEKLSNSGQLLQKLVEKLKKAELGHTPIILTDMSSAAGGLAKMLVDDLKYALNTNALALYYQPQHDAAGNCVGAEALLRWHHPALGPIYPPLIIKLAEESDMLERLERQVFKMAIADIEDVKRLLGSTVVLSVNISGKTIQSDSFEQFLAELSQEQALAQYGICIEVTEQMALLLDSACEERFARIHQMGFSLAIDDFSMGYTSLRYLEGSSFSTVKLDGCLIMQVENNQRVRDIIASIVSLSESLGFSVLAEYVESTEQRDVLERLGCRIYQGYLYSPALPLHELEHYAKMLALRQLAQIRQKQLLAYRKIYT